MITLMIHIPEPVAAEYFQAAEELNRRFGEMTPKIEARTLMSFALARHDSRDLCAQFDLALRLVGQSDEKPFNPVLQ